MCKHVKYLLGGDEVKVKIIGVSAVVEFGHRGWRTIKFVEVERLEGAVECGRPETAVVFSFTFQGSCQTKGKQRKRAKLQILTSIEVKMHKPTTHWSESG